jgi:hypothetical protein
MATDAKTNRKSSGTSRSPSGSAKAAKTAVEAHGTSLTVPSLGAVQLPSKGTLAYFAAVAGLAALGLLEWPVAVVIGVGHLLAQQRGNVLLEEFGEGLSDA